MADDAVVAAVTAGGTLFQRCQRIEPRGGVTRAVSGRVCCTVPLWPAPHVHRLARCLGDAGLVVVDTRRDAATVAGRVYRIAGQWPRHDAGGGGGAGGLGGILGGALGTALGGPVGTIVGSMGGDWLFKNLLGLFPDAAAGLGEAITPFFEKAPSGGEIPAKDYVIKTLPEDTVVGMGGTALGRTDEMVKLLIQQNQHLDKQNTLLADIKDKEGKIMIGATEIGTGFNVGYIKTL